MLKAALQKIGLFRASPENPSTKLSNPASWLINWMGGGQSLAGVSITPESALKYGPVFAAVRLISQSIASLPLHIYKRDGKNKERFPKHPVNSLLHDSPNPEMTAIIFRELLSVHALLWGNAYAYIDRNNAGMPLELLPLLPDRTYAERKKGVLLYFTTVNNTKLMLRPDQVLHIPALSLDGITGKSPITLARESIGLGLAAEGYGSAFFGNNASPGGVLEHPNKLSPEAAANLKDSWNANHAGFGKAHKTAILEEGMKFNPMSLSQKDAEFLETRKFQVTEIARWFNVPPSLIGDLERATFKNTEQQNLSFVMHSLRPWLVRFEQEFNRKLFKESEKSKLFSEHDVDGLLRGDLKTRYEGWRSAIGAGWMTRNEVRLIENLNPLDGLDEPVIPNNAVLVGDDPEPEGPSEPDQDPDADIDGDEEGQERSIIAPFLQDAARRIIKRETGELRQSIKKRSGEELERWLDTYYKEFRGVISQTFKPFANDPLALAEIAQVAERHVSESRAALMLCQGRSALEQALKSWEQSRITELQTNYKETVYGN